MDDEGIALGACRERIAELERGARTVIAVALGSRLLGLVALADSIKVDAAAAINRLIGDGIEPVMITGDNLSTARAVAAEIGVTKVFANVLPRDKAAQVRLLQGTGKQVAFVGDGINDAPALAQADLGIAIGTGTDMQDPITRQPLERMMVTRRHVLAGIVGSATALASARMVFGQSASRLRVAGSRQPLRLLPVVDTFESGQ